jgi:hypothetical protein
MQNLGIYVKGCAHGGDDILNGKTIIFTYVAFASIMYILDKI